MRDIGDDGVTGWRLAVYRYELDFVARDGWSDMVRQLVVRVCHGDRGSGFRRAVALQDGAAEADAEEVQGVGAYGSGA